MNRYLVLMSAFFIGINSYAMNDYKSGTMQLTGSFVKVNPSLYGGEIGAAYLLMPIEERALWVGPRLGFMWAGSSNESRFESQLGLEGVLWFVNAIGVGSSLDFLISDPVHFRIDPFLAVRFLRFQNDGAWAIRVGLPYDTKYQWGIQLGVSLQFSGVPNIGL